MRKRLMNRQVNKTQNSQRASSRGYKRVCIRTKQKLNYSIQDKRSIGDRSGGDSGSIWGEARSQIGKVKLNLE